MAEEEITGYISQEELEGHLKRDLATGEEAIFDVVRKAAESIIDNYCDTTFLPVDETTRYYDADGSEEIDIDACTEIDSVTVSGTELDDSQYSAAPINSEVKWSLRAKLGRFPRSVDGVAVTALFSSYVDEVPNEVKVATMLLCEDIYVNNKGKKKESIEGYSYELGSTEQLSDRLESLLAPFRQL